MTDLPMGEPPPPPLTIHYISRGEAIVIDDDDAARTHPVPPPGTRLILASENLLDQWGTRTERGERIIVEWGEPTAEGWYEPTFTVHADDVLAPDTGS